MKTSEQINEIAAALAKAQGEMESAKKDSTNPHYKSKYADLSSVWDACRAALSKHSLSVVQTLDTQGEDIVLVTRLVHSSGQWFESVIPLLLLKQDMQGMGAATTYARRYALAAICGIAQDDDDSEGAGTANADKTPGLSRTHAIKNVTAVKTKAAGGNL